MSEIYSICIQKNILLKRQAISKFGHENFGIWNWRIWNLNQSQKPKIISQNGKTTNDLRFTIRRLAGRNDSEGAQLREYWRPNAMRQSFKKIRKNSVH